MCIFNYLANIQRNTRYEKNKMKILEFKKQQLKLKKINKLTGWSQEKSGGDREVSLKLEG